MSVALLGVLLGPIVAALENQDWGYGLWMPSNWAWYDRRLSPLALFYFCCGVCLLPALPTAFAGGLLMTTAAVQQYVSLE